MPVVELHGGEYAGAFEGTLFDVSNEDYTGVFQSLLPPGSAWNRRDDSWLTKLLRGLSREPSRVEWQAARLIEEADPRTTQELLADWEAFAGLPDCGDVGEDLSQRQAALVAKLTQKTSPTKQAFIEIAETLGYSAPAVANNLADPFTCISNCDESLYGGPWIHAWSFTTFEVIDDDRLLQCLVNQLKPQHTTVLFQSIPGLVWAPDLETLHDPVSDLTGVANGTTLDFVRTENGLYVPTRELIGDGVTNENMTWASPSDITGNPFTIAVWLNLDAYTGLSFFEPFRVNGSGSPSSGMLIVIDGTGQVRFIRRRDTSDVVRQTDNPFPITGWVHLAISHDGGNDANNIHIYFDAVESLPTTILSTGAGTPVPQDGDWWLAGLSGTADRDIDGRIAKPYVWNRVLTPAEVETVYRLTRL